jgi:Nuclease-related domain
MLAKKSIGWGAALGGAWTGHSLLRTRAFSDSAAHVDLAALEGKSRTDRVLLRTAPRANEGVDRHQTGGRIPGRAAPLLQLRACAIRGASYRISKLSPARADVDLKMAYEQSPDSAGASAARCAQRLREQRQELAASRSGFARIVGALTGPSASEKQLIKQEAHWASGADGERKVAQTLARRCPDIALLHDRCLPGSRANIDHLAFAPTGIYVIDTKRHTGKISVAKALIGQPKLTIGGRDRTSLIRGLAKQVKAVEATLVDSQQDVPVHGCLCFIAPPGLLANSGLPLIGTLTIDGYPLYDPRRLAKRLSARGPLSASQTDRLLELVGERLAVAAQ